MIRDRHEYENKTNVGNAGFGVGLTVLLLAATLATLAGTAGATLVMDEVRELFEAGQYERAAAEGRALLSELERTNPDSLEVAEVAKLVVSAMAAGSFGDKQERLDLAERALEIRERWHADDESSLAFAHYWVGQVHYQSGHASEALPSFSSVCRCSSRSKRSGPSRQTTPGSRGPGDVGLSMRTKVS